MKFRKIEEYIKEQKENRQLHLNLNEKCIEIGGYDSREYRGLLAHFLKTTIPTGKKIHLCHACGNSKCSNVKHLYWGTHKENVGDMILHGTYKKPWDSTVEKYGLEEARKIAKQNASKGGKKGGGHNKLSESKINENKKIIDSVNPLKYGWVKRASKKLNISHTGVKKFIKSYYPELEYYQRK